MLRTKERRKPDSRDSLNAADQKTVQARKVKLRVQESGARAADRQMRAVEFQYGQGSDGGKLSTSS